ncbi:hypothetical protein [Sphingomonas sp. Leaf21]|nr:hypothetical protein [Sphingomonas sp. Leaf21]
MKEWLEEGMQPLIVDSSAHRMRELAVSIRMQCTELMHIAERVLGP